jgi:pantoate--beta-alanine ligase
VEDVTRRLEGAARPGHFRGVATIVAKLFNVIQPDRAYFGQKDAQQVVVIQRMTRDLNFPVQVVVCPTLREPDGLAMSSRNVYLTSEQRRAAPVLHRALSAAEAAWQAGERDASVFRVAMKAILDAEPLAITEYVSAADPETLTEARGPAGRLLLSLAVRIGKARLIDNLLLEEGGP